MPHDPKITKLEEAVAFNERTIDELSAELAKAYDRIEALSRRIDELESRMTDLEHDDILQSDDEAHDPAIERPPHAAGPPPD